ncbi:MAG: ABC transporter ATP-binding protein [Planctomycetes bacterium]|nr:ABC transporter ATP-binding protein [Planctomycetota bacterium]
MGVDDKPVVETKALSKNYDIGTVKVEALKDINLTIKRGEFVILSGPSGCGKSTLLSLIGCLDMPSGGDILLDGINVSSLDKDRIADLRNSKIGFVFQMYNLLPELNVFQNVQLPLVYADIARDEREERALKLLKDVNMQHRLSHKPAQLSGGERQRVTIARALINNPTFILADEPTGNLDSKSGGDIMDFFAELNRKSVTIFLVTHNPDVHRYGNRVINMKDGRFI